MKKDIVSLWTEYTAWLKKTMPKEFSTLQKPATNKDFAAFKEVTGYDFPENLKKLYRINNGSLYQTKNLSFPTPWFVLGGESFLPINGHGIDSIIGNWKTWNDVAKDPNNKDLESSPFNSAYPEDAIKNRYTNPKWIPITHDFGGNHIGVDLDPGVKGVVGQIINFGRDEDLKFVLANSFEEFLEQILIFINQGKVTFITEDDDATEWVVDGTGLVGAFMNVKEVPQTTRIVPPTPDTTFRTKNQNKKQLAKKRSVILISVAVILIGLVIYFALNQSNIVTNGEKCQEAKSKLQTSPTEYLDLAKYCLLPSSEAAQ